MVRAIMHGCNGAMGQVISGIAAKDEEISIVAGIDMRTEQKNDYPVFASLNECKVEADVVIDFSNAKAVDELLNYCGEKKLPLVLCTTGLSEDQLAKVTETSKETAILKSANMSLGINTLMDLLQTAIKKLAPAGFDVEIVEKHHNQKLDAPSGTALALADAMNEAMDNTYSYKLDRSSERKKRDAKEIGIQAVRGGSIVGEIPEIYQYQIQVGFTECIIVNASYFYISKEFVRDNIDIEILTELLSLGELVDSDANKVTNVFSTLF